jgi:hypothetical protein
MSSRVSSGFRRSRSPTTSPTSLARSGRRGSGCASSRPGVSAAASSSESGTASTGPRPAQFAGAAHRAAALRRPAGLNPTLGTPAGCRAQQLHPTEGCSPSTPGPRRLAQRRVAWRRGELGQSLHGSCYTERGWLAAPPAGSQSGRSGMAMAQGLLP